MKIKKRNLTLKEAGIISGEIKSTNNIIGYKPKELFKFGNTFVATESEKIVGILTYVELDDWIDLKIFLVVEAYRGKGYGKEIFDYSLNQLQKIDKSIYTVTRNPIVVELVSKQGFKETRLLKLPITVIFHQLSLALSIYRVGECIKKLFTLKTSNRFKYFELRK